jgi:hypothetical protein
MNNPGQQPSPNAEVNAFVNAVNGFSEAGAERYAGMNVADASSYNDTFRRENLSRMSNLAVDSMPNGSSWVDANGQWHVVVTGTSADVAPIDEAGSANATAVDDRRPYVVGEPLPPLAVQGTGLSFGRSSAYSYWSDIQDAGANQGSFLKYAVGGTMRTLSGVGYDIWDAAVGAEQNPSYLFSGAGKGAVNFGPELFNGAANALKTSLNGYSLIAERLGAGEGAFAGFRGSDAYSITPLYSYENKTEAGAAMLTNFAMAGGAAKYGSYAIELDAGSAGTLSANSLGLKFVSPRYQPGVVTYGDDLVAASGRWLDAGIPAPIPLQVAKQLQGRSFQTFDDLRGAVWQAVARDAELSKGFGLKNLQQMESGYAPFAPRAFQDEAFGLRFNLHHVRTIGNGGPVYDLSNIRIVSPKTHYGLHYE